MLRLVEETQFVFEPEELAKLGEAFDDCWERVLQSGVRFASEQQRQAAREILAKCFVDSARRARGDLGGLCEDAMLYWAHNRTQTQKSAS
jgi:hypothetical protein